jgi:hypothetical protein
MMVRFGSYPRRAGLAQTLGDPVGQRRMVLDHEHEHSPSMRGPSCHPYNMTGSANVIRSRV